MAINELLIGFRRAAVRSALGLALLVPAGYGCGDVENNYYGDGGGNNFSEKYSCEDAADNIANACKDATSSCYKENGGSEGCYLHTLKDCRGDNGKEPWPQEIINCWSEKCSGDYCH